ncbi:MAG TPA: hypothetical protein VEV84_05280 [Pyrinomonadaceae bacterium]|nr:hypothetical protein [Pyrinomonadaceae bacterium]
MLAAAVAIAAFFLALGLFREGGEPPWIPAGVAASMVLVGAVILRRAILKKAQIRESVLRQFEQNWRPLSLNVPTNENKLTIEQNAAILGELKRKSEAAMLLSKYSEGHREVFQLCSQYLELNERELRTVGLGSPRIAPLRRGREVAEEYHRLHMLKWAEVEARSLLEDAQSKKKAAEKVETANKALSIVDSALSYYPAEVKLSESSLAISEFVLMVKVADLIERAGRSALRGNKTRAEKLYSSALNQLGSETTTGDERHLVAEKIKKELDRLADSD